MKELITLSRKIKELWVFGPLGKEDLDQKVKEEEITKDVVRVAELWNSLEGKRMGSMAEEMGGKWESFKVDDPPATGAAL